MKQCPQIIRPNEFLVGHFQEKCTGPYGLPEIYLCRPEPYYKGLRVRLRLAWLVFTGECDALRWEDTQ